MPTVRVDLGGSAFKPHQCSPAGWAAVLLLTLVFTDVCIYLLKIMKYSINPVVLSVHFVSKAKQALKVEYSMLESYLSLFESSCAECWMESCSEDGDFVNVCFFSFKLLAAFRSREGCMLQHAVVLKHYYTAFLLLRWI